MYPSRSEGKRASRTRTAGTLVSKCLRAPGSGLREVHGGGAWTARDGIEAAMLNKTHIPVSDRSVCPPHSPRARSDVGLLTVGAEKKWLPACVLPWL